MNGVVRIDVANFVTVGLMAFLFVFIFNRLLKAIGQTKFTTEG